MSSNIKTSNSASTSSALTLLAACSQAVVVQYERMDPDPLLFHVIKIDEKIELKQYVSPTFSMISLDP